MKHTVALDTASKAVLLQGIIRARRVSCCPLCANPREIVTTEQGEEIVCKRCGDREEARKEETARD
jgi:hypothetical protein